MTGKELTYSLPFEITLDESLIRGYYVKPRIANIINLAKWSTRREKIVDKIKTQTHKNEY